MLLAELELDASFPPPDQFVSDIMQSLRERIGMVMRKVSPIFYVRYLQEIEEFETR